MCAAIDTVHNIATVANAYSNSVSVIDLGKMEVIKTIPVGMMPLCMHWDINPFTNQAIVALMGEDALSVIDLVEGVEIKKIPVGTAPAGAALDPYTNMAVVPCMGSGEVSVVDLTKGAVIGTIQLDPGLNCGIIEPTKNIALVSNYLKGNVTIIDLNAMSVIEAITTGIEPSCFAIDELTKTALVTNMRSNDITFIDLKKVSTATEDYSNVFFLELDPGLNMISLPLKPHKPLMAREFMDEIGATTVIKYDAVTRRFTGFTKGSSGDGFTIEGGKGYIVNVLEGKVITFVGAAWTNDLPALAAPPATPSNSAWAFVVNAEVKDSAYKIRVRNLNTGMSLDVVPGTYGQYSGVWADLSRQPVIHVGDVLEVTASDTTGMVGKLSYTVSMDDIRRAYVTMTIPADIHSLQPQASILLQNYPNPFNPETWIPFQLSKGTDVSVRIFEASGRLVRNLSLGHREAGYYVDKDRAVYWDGKNDAGEYVASGIYFYTIQAGEFSSARKMIITK